MCVRKICKTYLRTSIAGYLFAQDAASEARACPQPRGKEVDCLINLINQLFVVTTGSFSEWKR